MPVMLSLCVIGVGPIGLAAARLVHGDPQMRVCGLVDPAEKLLGTNPLEDGPAVVADVGEALQEADVAIICTTSRFDAMQELLAACCEAGTHVVSSCEEMLWPAYRHPDGAEAINRLAADAGVAMLGTGVNPGFVLDFLPLVASFVLPEVHRVRAVRRVEASTRRKPLQAKIGATLTVDQFEHRRDLGTIGHKGLAESVALLAAGLGATVEPGSVHESLEPILAEREMACACGTIKPGHVAGMHNVGRWRDGGLEVELDLIMSIGWPDPKDVIELHGPVPLRLKVSRGTPGDPATAAALVNAARVIPHARPGLRTMLDLGHLPASRRRNVIEH
jgi:4-hydroxy-tetrahydrodipicolinate reductase